MTLPVPTPPSPAHAHAHTAVRYDIWPCELQIDPEAPVPADRRHVYPARVVVTLTDIFVFTDGPFALVFHDKLLPGVDGFSPAVPPQRRKKTDPPSSSWNIARSDSGHTLLFRKSSGCGCGSKMKGISFSALLAATTPAPQTPATGFSTVASVHDKA